MSTLKLVPASGPPVEVEGDKAMVGRDASADVVVNDSSVSRKHARLERWGSNWAVIDQRSANGTFLDGQRVTESVLQAGQELRFGKVAYRVELPAADFGATVMMSGPVSEATVVQAPPARPAAPHAVAPAPPAPMPRPVPPRPAAPSASHAPAPYVAPHPEPVREGKGPLFWIVLTFGLLLVVALVGVGAVLGPAFLSSKAAVDAARAQIKDMSEGDMDAAYARTSAKYRAAHPAEAFAAFVERHPGLRRNTDANFNNRSVENDAAKISGTLTHGAGTEKAFYELVKEGGDWKVSGLEVDGDEGVAVASGTGGGLTVDTIAVNKTRQGQTVTIKIDIRVTGFDLRPEGNLFRVNLAEDLETIGPDGKRIDELSRAGLETYNQTTSSATDATATFNNALTFTRPEPGRYKAVITIRDLIGLKNKKHEVPFDLP
jgi:hypothetical protein